MNRQTTKEEIEYEIKKLDTEIADLQKKRQEFLWASEEEARNSLIAYLKTIRFEYLESFNIYYKESCDFIAYKILIEVGNYYVEIEDINSGDRVYTKSENNAYDFTQLIKNLPKVCLVSITEKRVILESDVDDCQLEHDNFDVLDTVEVED